MTEDLLARDRDWEAAFAAGRLPAAVAQRLGDARAGRTPWVASLTPAELLAARSHGLRPVATVSGTCWMHYGYSWTEGHGDGWTKALERIGQEAVAAGANAVVDVELRTTAHAVGQSQDFTLVGTAVRVAGLPASDRPVIATVPALEFVRLVEMGIVPTGLAVGARFEWLEGWGMSASTRSQQASWQTSVFAGCQPVPVLGKFWEKIRREAIAQMKRRAGKLGNGVLAHTHFGQLLRQERDKQPPNYLGRHIVVGTVVDVAPRAGVPHGIAPVVDMRGAASPLDQPRRMRHSAYLDQEEGAI